VILRLSREAAIGFLDPPNRRHEVNAMRSSRTVAAILVLLLVAGQATVAGQQRPVVGSAAPNAVRAVGLAAPDAVPTVDLAAVDAVFEAFDNTRSPGCAVGVSQDGVPVLLRAYGMADLEHDVPNTAETILEPGSVAKQFTAAATILLALDGKISLDDDVRKYIPELPDYGDPITIRHLMNHTSGLRDWGSVAGIEGWPRTRRAHTHTHVLDIASRQRALNYRPGDYYSYTNTGYNLQAILVERVSGMSFAEFSRVRIFEPLGMSRTQWRDDFTRIVKDRAVAYRGGQGATWSMLMPFENVHGNGGLLTTVEDLLRFTRNLETGELGGPRFLEEMHRQGVLNSGQVIHYAAGLQVGTYRGVREVAHSGSTAGYRGHLSRFPDHGLAVAVICNASTANAGRLLHQVADLYLGDLPTEPAPAVVQGAISLPGARLAALAGAYRDTRTGTLVQIMATQNRLRLGGTELVPVSESRFESGTGTVLRFESTPFAHGRPAAFLDSPGADNVRLEPVGSFEPTAPELVAYAGTYRSDEAEATYEVEVGEEGVLVLRDRWGQRTALRPLYPDAFSGGGSTFIFRRGTSGQVQEMSLSQGRVWDLRFRKVG
jgi:CubicO group peptidase (beta-lactamase class C family)